MVEHELHRSNPDGEMPWYLARRRPIQLTAVIGDGAVLLVFAAIGRRQHHDMGAVFGTIEVAGPFLLGWFLAAALLGLYRFGAFREYRPGILRVEAAWLLGGAIGLLIRSGLEHRIVPVTFILIALVFNLACFGLWRSAMWVLGGRW